MTTMPNSWKFASSLDQTVIEYLNKFDPPIRKEVIQRLKEDFEHGIVPTKQRYELDARL